jgi:hypothetical protein
MTTQTTKTFLLICLAALITLGCVTELTVRRHSTVSLSDAAADGIFGDFSAIVYVKDSSTDVACATDFGQYPCLYLRDGAVGTYAGPSAINSQADFNAVIAAPGYIKVVGSIGWCGQFLPGIIGCAPVPGSSLTVVRFTSSMEGSLWAHEFGHTTGLDHRSGPRNLMDPTMDPGQNEIDAFECLLIGSKYDWIYGQESVLAEGGVDGMTDAQFEPVGVEEFVRRVYIHGTPMIAAMQYGEADVAPLLEMLADPDEKDHWGNVVAVLGVIGDESVAEALIGFASRPRTEPIDWEGAKPLSSAMMGLGYLLNRTGSRLALDYLTSATNRGVWLAGAEVEAQLRTSAMIGLALSGHPEARDVLLRAERESAGEAKDALSASAVAEALEAHALIAAEGLEGYYRR